MKLNYIKMPIKNILSMPSTLAPTAFVSIGVAKTCQDYYEASDKEKKKVLLKDLAILSGSVASLATVTPLTRWFTNTKFMDLFANSINILLSTIRGKSLFSNNSIITNAQKIVSHTEHVIKEALAATINTFVGVMGAVHANEFMYKFIFPKFPSLQDSSTEVEVFDSLECNKSKPQDDNGIDVVCNEGSVNDIKAIFDEFSYVEDTFNKKTVNRVFSAISDLPGMKAFEKPFVALSGFSVAETKGYKNKFKKTLYDLLANTLIPTIFISATSLFVDNKKMFVKYPSLLLSLVTGSLLGGVVADKVKDKIDKGVDNIGSRMSLM